MSEPKHTLRIDYDDETGALTVTHRCAVELAGQVVSTSEEVRPGDAKATAASLKAWIDSNREAMEAAAQVAAVQHVAATTGRAAPGAKQLKAGGSLGAAGITSKKEPRP